MVNGNFRLSMPDFRVRLLELEVKSPESSRASLNRQLAIPNRKSSMYFNLERTPPRRPV
jgi:hypothetical protein